MTLNTTRLSSEVTSVIEPTGLFLFFFLLYVMISGMCWSNSTDVKAVVVNLWVMTYLANLYLQNPLHYGSSQ